MVNTKSNIPVSNSTPKNIRVVSRRPGIHDHDEESPGVHQLSPILKASLIRHKERLYHSDELDDSGEPVSDSEDDSTRHDTSLTSSHKIYEHSNNGKPHSETSETSSINNNVGTILYEYKLAIFTTLVGICATVLFLCPGLPTSEELQVVVNTRLTMKDLRDKYPSQPSEVWDNVGYSVIDSNERHKPATFLLMYDNSSKKTTFQLVRDMASYSKCVLNPDCSYEPIIINSSKLDPTIRKNDIISKYISELKEKFVMIVLDVDGLSGIQAQNFHFLCDMYSPEAFKSVYFFTVNVEGVNNSSNSDWHMVEGILRNSYKDLDDDKFYPLLTRLTNILIKVVPEDHII